MQGCHSTSPGEQVGVEALEEEALIQPGPWPHLLGTPAWLPSLSQPADCCCKHCPLSDLHTIQKPGTEYRGETTPVSTYVLLFFLGKDRNWGRLVMLVAVSHLTKLDFVSCSAIQPPLQREGLLVGVVGGKAHG